ncbi:hypothetical protein FCE95_01715 [Luteimonas gilva]|uniref:Uncharacterized protein n=1 Tax=Luteimonas gilva TaxID=2572684 RepID=A0A4U5JT97_9GAMM|nr:DUF6587 family protein [Luteimonas gilva]TKR33060.1 hypothetical protein FCE95_01715 [Luteimonas gilva]
MSASLLLQYFAIALAVLASALFVAKRQFPNAVRRLRIACALPLVREGRPAWLRALGKRIAPPVSPAGAGACGGCDNCETPSHS